MKNDLNRYALRASVLAVQSAIVAITAMPCAYAEDDIAALTKPTNTVEIGATYTKPSNGDNRGVVNNSNGDNTSYKAGEYNGLQKKGATIIGNFDVSGGGKNDASDATRWHVTGTDLGLETRNLTAEFGEQGKFRVNFGYDEFLRNKSDTYQTPYSGAGTNSLTLPSNWIVPIVPQNNATSLNARALSSTTGLANGPYVYTAPGGVPTWTQTAATAGNITAVQAIQTADLPAFHNENISTKRTKLDGGLLFNIDRQWDFQFSAQHEKKDGTQLMGTVSRVAPSTGGSVTDAAATIPYLINQETDQFNASLNYKNDNSFVQAAYYGSLFRNNVSSMSWQNWQTGTTVAGGTGVATAHPFTTTTESTAPSNQFHQFSLTGGYNFDRNTKLVVNASYGRNTQNQAFLTDTSTVVVPQSSLNGVVVSKAFSMKLTAKPAQDLKLAAAYKYDVRDNRTPVNTYQYADTSETPAASTNFTGLGVSSTAPAVLAQNANANRAYSKRVNQINLDADYAVAKGHALKAGFDWQKIDRWCNGSWIDCVDAATTKENTLRLDYRSTVLENVSGRVGYAYSQRRVSNYNENAFLALVPYANVVPIGQTISAYQSMLNNGLNGWGSTLGYNGGVIVGAPFFANNNALANALYANNNRISELPGMRRYNMADRNRDKLRSSMNWQATDKLSFQGGFDYNKDDYSNSIYGLQSAKSWALNLDGTYSATDDLSFTAYYTYEDQKSRSAGNNYATNSNTANVNGQTAVVGGCFSTIQTRNNNNKIDPCENWSVDMRDQVDTLGINVKHKGLLAGKLEMAGDLTFTRARTNYGASGGVYVNNPLAVAGTTAATMTAAFYIPATALPEVKTDTIEIKINGKYTIDKSAAVRVGYSYLRMKTTDYAYDGMQYGSLATVLPSNEQSPNYTVHSIGAAYIYTFQ